MLIKRPTKDALLALRDERGIGLQEAYRCLRREAIDEAIAQATTIDDMREVLDAILELIP